MSIDKLDAEKLVNVVDEYLHWRKVNPHIKGGENYLKRLRTATKTDQPVEYPSVRRKRKELNPSLEAQKIRSALAHEIDVDDSMPDVVWDVADLAAQIALNSPKRESVTLSEREIVKELKRVRNFGKGSIGHFLEWLHTGNFEIRRRG